MPSIDDKNNSAQVDHDNKHINNKRKTSSTSDTSIEPVTQKSKITKNKITKNKITKNKITTAGKRKTDSQDEDGFVKASNASNASVKIAKHDISSHPLRRSDRQRISTENPNLASVPMVPSGLDILASAASLYDPASVPRVFTNLELSKTRTMQRLRTYKMAWDATNYGMTKDIANNLPFETLFERVKDTTLQQTMNRFVRRLIILTAKGVDSLFSSMNIANNKRLFVTSFMIVCNQVRYFPQIGDEENDLIAKATVMLRVFEDLSLAIRTLPAGSDPSTAVDKAVGFGRMFRDYHTSFFKWKTVEHTRILERFKAALAVLYKHEISMTPQDANFDHVTKMLLKQHEEIRVRLTSLVGDRAPKIIEDYRTEYMNKPLSKAMFIMTRGDGAQSNGVRLLPRKSQVTAMQCTTSEQLVHEVLLYPSFKFDKRGGFNFESRADEKMRVSCESDFYKAITTDLMFKKPKYVRVLRLLGKILHGFNDLQDVWCRATAVHDILDMDVIKQQVVDKSFTWKESSKLLLDLMTFAKTCGIKPEQSFDHVEEGVILERMNTAVTQDEKAGAITGMLKLLLDYITSMRVVAATYRLDVVKSSIRSHGVAYEKRHFENKLRQGSLQIPSTNTRSVNAVKTYNFVHDSMMSLMRTGHFKFEDFTDNANRAKCYHGVVQHGIVRIITAKKPPRAQDIAETLRLDVHRFRKMHHVFMFHVSAAIVLGFLQKMLIDWAVTGRTAMIHKATDAMFSVTDSANIESVVDVMDKTMTGLVTTEQREYLAMSFRRFLVPSGYVFTKFVGRFRTFYDEGLALSTHIDIFRSRASVAETIDNHHLPPIIILFWQSLHTQMNALRCIVNLTNKVHAGRYTQQMVRATLKIRASSRNMQTPSHCACSGFDGDLSRRRH